MPNQAEAAVREALPSPTAPVTDARLPLALLAQVGGGIETTIHPDSWRRPHATTAGWLRYLVSVGYEPADVEQLIIATAPLPTAADHAGGDGPTGAAADNYGSA